MAIDKNQVGIEVTADTSKATSKLKEVSKAIQGAETAAVGASDASQSLDQNMAGLSATASFLSPKVGAVIALMDTLKLAEAGADSASIALKNSFGTLISTLKSPTFLAAAGTFGAIAAASALAAGAQEKEAEAMKRINDLLDERKKKEAALRGEQEKTAETAALEISKGLVERGIVAEDAQGQEHRLTGRLARVQQATAGSFENVKEAVLEGEQRGLSERQVEQLVNLRETPLGKQFGSVEEQLAAAPSFAAATARAAADRAGSTVGKKRRAEGRRLAEALKGGALSPTLPSQAQIEEAESFTQRRDELQETLRTIEQPTLGEAIGRFFADIPARFERGGEERLVRERFAAAQTARKAIADIDRRKEFAESQHGARFRDETPGGGDTIIHFAPGAINAQPGSTVVHGQNYPGPDLFRNVNTEGPTRSFAD